VVVVPFNPLPHHGGGRWLLRLRNLPQRNFYGALGAECEALEGVVDAVKPEVILCHFGTVALRVLPPAMRCGVPLVVHFHGIDITGALSDRWYSWSLRRWLGHFAAMVIVAEYQREILLSLGASNERIHLIPCGVPIEDLAVQTGLGNLPCRFVSVGRLVDKKSPLPTLRAFAHCLAQVPGCQLRIVGDGPLLEAARRTAEELGVAGQVTFLGCQAREVVAEELVGASVFVQHSVTSASGDMEGWPVAIAEAMAAGLPVVATRHAGIPDQVTEGDSGFLVAEHDWQTMGERMVRLARDPDLRLPMGIRSRATAVRRFDQSQMVARLEEVLQAAARVATWRPKDLVL
jgi:glycosyltransferase involved in cell wall biosynthesis